MIIIIVKNNSPPHVPLRPVSTCNENCRQAGGRAGRISVNEFPGAIIDYLHPEILFSCLPGAKQAALHPDIHNKTTGQLHYRHRRYNLSLHTIAFRFCSGFSILWFH